MMNQVQAATAYPLGKRSDRMSHGQRLTMGLGAVTTTSSLPHDSATVAPYSVAESFFLSKTSDRTPLASGPRWLNPDG
jgi:hypothetical protein